jgi:hypothetical protein
MNKKDPWNWENSFDNFLVSLNFAFYFQSKFIEWKKSQKIQHGSLKRDVFQKYDTVQSNDGVF